VNGHVVTCTIPFTVPVTTFAVDETAVSATITAVEQLCVKTIIRKNIVKFLTKVFIQILNLR